ncbi:MAG: metal-dependent hydrolase [Pyrinomonadaceae bacterium]
MASAFSHAFVALAMGKLYAHARLPARFRVLSVICAVLPDADVLGFSFGIHYGDMLGHRGLTHSLLFALATGSVVVWLFFKDAALNRGALVFYFFLVTASHGALDALTNGGLGVAFFAPFENSRYFFPFRPVEVSPIGIGDFFSSRGAAVLVSEFIWLWIPAALIVILSLSWRKWSRRRRVVNG